MNISKTAVEFKIKNFPKVFSKKEKIFKSTKIYFDGKTKNINIPCEKKDNGKTACIIKPFEKHIEYMEFNSFSKEQECITIKEDVVYAVVKEIYDKQNILLRNDPLKNHNAIIEVYLVNNQKLEIKAKYNDTESKDGSIEIYDNSGIVLQSKINYIENVKSLIKNIFQNIKQMKPIIEPKDEKSKLSLEKHAKEEAYKIIDKAINGISKNNDEFVSAKMIATELLSKSINTKLEKERQSKIDGYISQISEKIISKEVKGIFAKMSAKTEKLKASKVATKVINDGVKKLKIKGKKSEEFKEAKKKLSATISKRLLNNQLK